MSAEGNEDSIDGSVSEMSLQDGEIQTDKISEINSESEEEEEFGSDIGTVEVTENSQPFSCLEEEEIDGTPQKSNEEPEHSEEEEFGQENTETTEPKPTNGTAEFREESSELPKQIKTFECSDPSSPPSSHPPPLNEEKDQDKEPLESVSVYDISDAQVDTIFFNLRIIYLTKLKI